MRPWLAVALALASACAPLEANPSRKAFVPTRFDYEAFRARHSDIPDPNYLPFMAQRFELEGTDRDAIVFCRWASDRFPLAVYVEPPRIDPAVQDEFNPKEPSAYAAAVERALESWQEALPDIVRFRRVERSEDADLTIRIVGTEGPAPEDGVQVLGATPVYRACRVLGGKLENGRLDVDFEVPRFEIFVADRHGMLPPDQVERLALHELGHALGMRGHSPIPADLMYEVAQDRRVDRLSSEDVNSFRALYTLPNGTLYGETPRGESPERSPATAPSGPPVLSADPYVDESLGFALRVPEGWRTIPAPRGVVAIDGVPWDYEASFQVIVRSYPSVREYLERHVDGHVGVGEVIEQGHVRVADRAGFGMRVLQRGGETTEDHVFVETGDGRILVVITDSATELRDGFDPWFLAMLESLEIRPLQR